MWVVGLEKKEWGESSGESRVGRVKWGEPSGEKGIGGISWCPPVTDAAYLGHKRASGAGARARLAVGQQLAQEVLARRREHQLVVLLGHYGRRLAEQTAVRRESL